MGFICESYSENHVGLVVSFSGNKNTTNFFTGDSVAEAMKYFNIYEKDGMLYKKTEDSQALQEIGINNTEATDFRVAVDSLIQTMTDEEAAAAIVLFPVWQSGKDYNVNDRVKYNNKLYKVLQAHTSQDDWTPDVAASLFACLLTDEEGGTIQEWVQPDSTNGYSAGDKVTYNGAIYTSLIDNNVWSPADYPAGWNKEV